MSKTLLVYLTESVLLLPVPLYCIYQELWGGGKWLVIRYRLCAGGSFAGPLCRFVSWAGGSVVHQRVVLLCRFFSVNGFALLARVSLGGWGLCLWQGNLVYCFGRIRRRGTNRAYSCRYSPGIITASKRGTPGFPTIKVL